MTSSPDASPWYRPSEAASSAPTGVRQRHAGPATAGVQRVAELQLRGRTGAVPARVYWPRLPEDVAAPGLLVFVPARDRASGGLDAADAWSRSLCAGVGIVVLSTSYRTTTGADHRAALDDAIIATQWSADHAAELDAAGGRLLVGGEGFGAALAAAVAVHARDEGWPPILRQLLIAPRFGSLQPRASALAGVAPATVVTLPQGPRDDDSSRYATRLRQAGVAVDQLHVGLPPSDGDLPAGESPPTPETAALVAQLVRSLEADDDD